MGLYEDLRRLMEMEQRRPPGVELDPVKVPTVDEDPLYGEFGGRSFGQTRGRIGGGHVTPDLSSGMDFFSTDPNAGAANKQINQTMLAKLSQPLPGKSSMQDNAMGAAKGFMMGYGMGGMMGGGGGAGMSTSGLGGMEGAFGGAEGGVGAFGAGAAPTTSAGTFAGIGSAGPAGTGMSASAEFVPPDVFSSMTPMEGTMQAEGPGGATPDIGSRKGGEFGGPNAFSPEALEPQGSPGQRSPTSRSAFKEMIDELISGKSPAEYFAKKMGATPAQQQAAKMIQETVLSKRKKGQAGQNAGLVVGLAAAAMMSDERVKADITPASPDRALEAIRNLPVTNWRYADEQTRHTGPTAQAVDRAFGPGMTSERGGVKHVHLGDLMGQLIGAVQALDRRGRR